MYYIVFGVIFEAKKTVKKYYFKICLKGLTHLIKSGCMRIACGTLD